MASYTPLSISSYALCTAIAFEIMADADMWGVRSQARSSPRGDHGYYAAAQGAAISARTEVDGARIFLPTHWARSTKATALHMYIV
ncbi:hypothetical protein C8J57DRAFT_1355113 [Mycena rebaudengoi]|nr:hypothetical protein C8J57DRAFT_1355113 [Mycena rebaudengoi]